MIASEQQPSNLNETFVISRHHHCVAMVTPLLVKPTVFEVSPMPSKWMLEEVTLNKPVGWQVLFDHYEVQYCELSFALMGLFLSPWNEMKM